MGFFGEEDGGERESWAVCLYDLRDWEEGTL
jgi:hypothetical protein